MQQSKPNPAINEIIRLTSKVIKDALKDTNTSGVAGIVVRNIVRKNIEVEGRPKWAPWAPGYAKVRRLESNKYPLHIGHRTGDMYDKMVYDNGVGKVSVYSKVPYAGDFDLARPLYVIPQSEYIRIGEAIMRVM